MPADDEAETVAVLLPAPEAARAAVALWEAGEAVVPLDPAAPAPDLRRSLAALLPTAVLDGDGRRPCPGGVPVAAGVAAVVATSGTTGERKGVELTFAGLAASGSAVASAVGGDRDGGWLCCLPVHLVAGLAVVGRAWATGGEAGERGPGGAGAGAGAGEILLRAPMLMRGYRLWPEGTAAAIDGDGWYRTGDVGRFDPAAGGRLRIVDRLGDMVNTGGVKVSPTEVERLLAGHPAV